MAMSKASEHLDDQLTLPLALAASRSGKPECIKVAGLELAILTQAAPGSAGPNQDAVLILEHHAGTLIMAIADGVGGHASGDIASAIAIDALRRASAVGSELPVRAAILNGFESAHQALKEQSSNLATTLVVVEIAGSTLRTYNAGDSGILVTGQRGRIKLQSLFHSPTGYAVEAGMLDPGAALHHADRHFVSNLLGLEPMSVEVSSPLTLAAHDTVVIASDGLFDNVYVEEIAALARKGPLRGACERLTALARDRMLTPRGRAPSKPDDLSIILARRLNRPTST